MFKKQQLKAAKDLEVGCYVEIGGVKYRLGGTGTSVDWDNQEKLHLFFETDIYPKTGVTLLVKMDTKIAISKK